jgi:hypothetical protein
MLTDGVSPAQGHEPIASHVTAHAPSVHSSPILFSQFRGPFPMNMSETEEERIARENKEKQTNFDKVREKAEREEAARKVVEAERDKLLKEKADRDAADKAAADAKLKEQNDFKALADQKEAEAKAKSDEAAAEKARADGLQAKVKAFEDAQEAELAEILKTIPDDKKPRLALDTSKPVAERLELAKYAKSLIKPDGPLGGGNRKTPNPDKQSRLKELLAKPRRTEEESAELAALSGETA